MQRILKLLTEALLFENVDIEEMTHHTCYTSVTPLVLPTAHVLHKGHAPISLTSTPTRAPSEFERSALRRVVLPEPRKPVRTVKGIACMALPRSGCN